MNTPPPPPSGVVLDEPEAHALLYAAIHEGLADSSPIIGDGFVGGILERKPRPEVLDRAFEQLVLGGKIWTPFPLPGDWHGELFESGMVGGAKTWEAHNGLLESIDGDVVLEMLRVRGIVFEPSTYDGILDRLSTAFERWNRVSDEPLLQFNLRRFVDHSFRRESSVDPVVLSAATELTDALVAARPITECVQAYSRVIGTALQFQALSSLPFRAQPGPMLKLREPPLDAVERFVIANVVCRELRTTPRASTLRGTLALAQTSAAEALRLKLTTWTECLRCGNDHIETARREVVYAQKELATARTWLAAGTLYTVLAIPISLFNYVSPVISEALNWSVTVGGVIAAGASASLFRRNRWAMFGSVAFIERISR